MVTSLNKNQTEVHEGLLKHVCRGDHKRIKLLHLAIPVQPMVAAEASSQIWCLPSRGNSTKNSVDIFVASSRKHGRCEAKTTSNRLEFLEISLWDGYLPPCSPWMSFLRLLKPAIAYVPRKFPATRSYALSDKPEPPLTQTHTIPTQNEGRTKTQLSKVSDEPVV